MFVALLSLPFCVERCSCFWLSDLNSGRQNLAALCTAAGKNLAAIGGSHSLAETVDLGSLTTAGLIGTLHEYTSCHFSINAQQPKNRPQQNIVIDHK